MSKKKKSNSTDNLPTSSYDYLIKSGLDETIALEIDEYEKQKSKRRKRMEVKSKKEEKWN